MYLFALAEYILPQLGTLKILNHFAKYLPLDFLIHYRCGREGHWSKECPQYPDYPA